MHLADCNALAARLGWMPSYPSFDRNPLDLADAAEAEGLEPADYVVRELKAGRLRFAAEDPDAPGNYPRVLTLWRANLLGSSSKGHEYFLTLRARSRGRRDPQRGGGPGVPAARRRLARRGAGRQARPLHDDRLPDERLGALLGRRAPGRHLVREARPLEHRPAPVRPLVQPGGAAAVGDPDATSTRSGAIAEAFTRLAEKHLGVRRDLVAAPLLHDTPDELAQPFGEVRDWRPTGECEPVPGKTMPKLVVVERDYARGAGQVARARAARRGARGSRRRASAWKPLAEVEELRRAERRGRRPAEPGRATSTGARRSSPSPA